MASKSPELGDLLIREGLISADQLDDALTEQVGTHERLGEILCRRGDISRVEMLETLAGQLGYALFDPTRDAVETNALDLVPVEFSRRHNVLPVKLDEEYLAVAMADPLDVEALDHLRRFAARASRELEILVAPVGDLDSHREKAYTRVAGTRNVNQLIDRVVDEMGDGLGAMAIDDDPQRHANDAGVVNLVDQIIIRALQERATDVHIEPQEHSLVIRYRIDGLLHDALTPPHAVYTGTISRIKILADMDIAERRKAQDGRFTHRLEGREVDIRVSAIPTLHGEKLVLRLLDKTNFNFSLRDLGFSEDDYHDFVQAIRRPFGMILLSGPTGSGKTTTLYASLLRLRDETLNVTTVEDPVEYQIERINQVQVNAYKDVTFANALRSFLRQDPDVIMVGEIRDQETADIAIRAALTGHMVFSTIHANDAPTTAIRLVSIGVEPFMASSALTMVAAQRLVRRCCPHCLEEYEPAEETLMALGANTYSDETLRETTFVRGGGCLACNGRGFLGRIAIVEKMLLTPETRQLIAERRPATEIRAQALSEGMTSLRRSGLDKVAEGITTLEEVVRVCLSDE